MIEKIIEFSIRNRFVVILVAAMLAAWGVYAVVNTPVDAIPDLSENQVIVFTDWMGRSPKEIEDQITYPFSVNLQGLAGVKVVRSSSEFNFSMINVIFEDHVDFYFARQRVLERLTLAGTFLPPGVVPYLAPDATALGQIFWYTVEGPGYDLGRLRAEQDWYVRYQLNSVPGVAQVASVGGYPIEYQIDVDPNKLRSYGVTLGELYGAVARANSSVGGRVIHKGNAEYLIRGVGWIRSLDDIRDIVIKSDPLKGTPITVASLATVGRGAQFRRSVLEKDGNEVTGAVVMMRHGENPLAVTRRIKDKILELQPGLPPGVRIVPFYDRTRLVEGAIHALTTVLSHEMIIASVAILLILMHFRSAFLICLTLPMAVLVSFILMRLVGVASNIMSLTGIAISIGILVDQAIVMVENATHHLTAHFGREKVRGDTRELVIPACRTVGRPIFFSVMIILLSFAPVFAFSGQEGKMIFPLACTKSFAMVGVALLSITLVPALVPTLIRGRLRTEEESWLVRSLIRIWKPLLVWALPRRNLVMWSFAVLLIVGAGVFPLAAVVPLDWQTTFLAVVALTMAVTVGLMRGRRWQLAAFLSLALLSLAAANFPKIGTDYMPPLDEGSILDMPVTVPRASVAEVADDIKARDALIRRFPEVEMVVGKAGRADTPTDPSPLDMIETVITLRPKEYWPRRKMAFAEALRQAGMARQLLVEAGWLKLPAAGPDREKLLNDVTMAALDQLDGTLRELVLRRVREFEAGLGPRLLRESAAELLARWEHDGRLLRPLSAAERDELAESLAAPLAAELGPWLAAGPAPEDIQRLIQKVATRAAAAGAVTMLPELFTLQRSPLKDTLWTAGELLGLARPTLFTEMLDFVNRRRDTLWREQVKGTDYEAFDQAVGAINWYCLDGLRRQAREQGLWSGPADDSQSDARLREGRAELDAPLAARLLLWQKDKSEIVQEMNSVLQVPGWGNIWTQPIINRVDMLATGVRTMIGVKVFGKDLNQIQEVSNQVAAVLNQVPGAADVTADQIRGKGYLEITIDRKRAARYGVNVGDIQDVIEVALGGKTITNTVEGRERYPVRIRYGRAWREDEEAVRNLLVSASGGMVGEAASGDTMMAKPLAASPPSAVHVPLAMVADVKIVEGPSMIKSENGRLRSYVQLNVRGRDVLGFVDEARRLVDQKVNLPQGMNLEWSGQFEHQVRARNTMLVVYPLVLLLIFVILYLTFNDLVDALLMMMAVPEALVGGAMLLWLTRYHFLGLPELHFSVAVQVGFIACLGMATETAIIMLVYLREALHKRGGLEKIASLEELRQAVVEGTVHRLRPKLLTEGVAIVALAPMLWATGVGHELLNPMAAPVLGGLLIADEVVDIFIPVRFYWVRRARWLKLHPGAEEATG
ncbi:MAG: efflux RND transporter permease subunit [Thermoguttaceae bacterium]|jgi:Cu(I)/Ag(I) efflux system membrane protein CusA/SilA